MTKPNKNFESVSTDELFNDEEPNLDISETWSPVFSRGFIFNSDINTLDGLRQTTSGSASISLERNRVDISTGSTDGSEARINGIAGASGAILSWESDRRAQIWARPEDTQGPLYWVAGRVTGADKTQHHVGFRIAGGDLDATVADGSTQNTATISSSPTTGEYLPYYIEFDAGNEARFWVDKNPNTNSPDATLSSNNPSGLAKSEHMYTYHVENASSGASDRILRAVKVMVRQQP